MSKYRIECSVGVFVFLGMLCLGYLTLKLGKMEVFPSDDTTVNAKFSSVAGLRSGANVDISGVTVGKVARIVLDDLQTNAIVTMRVNKNIKLTDDTFASIKTSGLIGDKYISLSLGAGDPLSSDGTLTDTEPALDLESLISKYVFGDVKK